MTNEEKAPLGVEDIARLVELDETIAPLLKEQKELTARFKEEIDEGKFPADEYLVHRWDQTGALADPLEFSKAYPSKQFPEMWTDVFVGSVIIELPPEEHPKLYKKAPDASAIKEHLSEEERKRYFKQTPYLKVRRLEPGEVIDDE